MNIGPHEIIAAAVAGLAAGTAVLRGRVKKLEERVRAVYEAVTVFNETSRQIVANEKAIEVVLDMMMRNARTEAIVKGLATLNSPFLITQRARECYAPMAAELKDFYRKVGVNMTPNELFLEVQRRFGDRILRDVCLPLELISNACILIAIEIAKESD